MSGNLTEVIKLCTTIAADLSAEAIALAIEENPDNAMSELNDVLINQSNAMLSKLATGINFVVDVLETLAGGGIVSIAGARDKLDSLLA